MEGHRAQLFQWARRGWESQGEGQPSPAACSLQGTFARPGPLVRILKARWAGMERLKPVKQAALPSSGGYKASLLFNTGAGRWVFNV